MIFKHSSLVLFAAFVTLLANTAFANSASPFQTQGSPLVMQSDGNFAAMYANGSHLMHRANTQSQTVSLNSGAISSSFGSAITIGHNAADTSSVFSSSRPYPVLDTNISGAQEPTFYYAVAEPGTLTLFGTGLVFLAGIIRRKFAKA